MAIDVIWPTPTHPTGTIFVPRADTVLVDPGPPERRSLDVNWLRGQVSLLWASEDGAPYSRPFLHNTEVTISGILFGRQIVFLAPYTIEFEDGQYSVRLTGANHNVDDVTVPNQVRIVTNLSAGLIRVAAVDEASVQAAMTAQGYTVARAPQLDALDANVSSRAAPSDLANLDAAVSTRALPGEGLTAEQATQLLELYRILGLDLTGPTVVSKTARMAPGILQEVVSGGGIVTVTRKP